MMRRGVVRDRKKEAFWRRHVRAQRAAGESVRAYCRGHGLEEPAFYWWRRELARRDAAQPQAAFVPVMLQSPAAVGQVEGIALELRGGRVLRLPAMGVGQVVALVRALEGDVKAGAA
jgi:hypothetical protein